MEEIGLDMKDAQMLLRPVEVAETLRIGRTKAYELIGAGTIPSLRIGGSVRVPADALRAWIRRQVADRTGEV